MSWKVKEMYIKREGKVNKFHGKVRGVPIDEQQRVIVLC
jgi:hypothetical protein